MPNYTFVELTEIIDNIVALILVGDNQCSELINQLGKNSFNLIFEILKHPEGEQFLFRHPNKKVFKFINEQTLNACDSNNDSIASMLMKTYEGSKILAANNAAIGQLISTSKIDEMVRDAFNSGNANNIINILAANDCALSKFITAQTVNYIYYFNDQNVRVSIAYSFACYRSTGQDVLFAHNCRLGNLITAENLNNIMSSGFSVAKCLAQTLKGIQILSANDFALASLITENTLNFGGSSDCVDDESVASLLAESSQGVEVLTAHNCTLLKFITGKALNYIIKDRNSFGESIALRLARHANSVELFCLNDYALLKLIEEKTLNYSISYRPISERLVSNLLRHPEGIKLFYALDFRLLKLLSTGNFLILLLTNNYGMDLLANIDNDSVNLIFSNFLNDFLSCQENKKTSGALMLAGNPKGLELFLAYDLVLLKLIQPATLNYVIPFQDSVGQSLPNFFANHVNGIKFFAAHDFRILKLLEPQHYINLLIIPNAIELFENQILFNTNIGPGLINYILSIVFPVRASYVCFNRSYLYDFINNPCTYGAHEEMPGVLIIANSQRGPAVLTANDFALLKLINQKTANYLFKDGNSLAAILARSPEGMALFAVNDYALLKLIQPETLNSMSSRGKTLVSVMINSPLFLELVQAHNYRIINLIAADTWIYALREKNNLITTTNIVAVLNLLHADILNSKINFIYGCSNFFITEVIDYSMAQNVDLLKNNDLQWVKLITAETLNTKLFEEQKPLAQLLASCEDGLKILNAHNCYLARMLSPQSLNLDVNGQTVAVILNNRHARLSIQTLCDDPKNSGNRALIFGHSKDGDNIGLKQER